MPNQLKPALLHDQLLRVLDYDPIKGEFRWKESKLRTRIGAIAGSLPTGEKGRWVIRIEGQNYTARRLAWFYMTGEYPFGFEVIAKDRDESNIRFNNLEKHINSPHDVACKANTARSGHKGIKHAKDKWGDWWRVRVTHEGKIRLIGTGRSLEEALEIRETYLNEVKGITGEQFDKT